MSDSRQQRSQSSVRQGDGVRVIVKKKSAGPWVRVLPIAALLFLGGLAYLMIDTTTMKATEPTPEPEIQALGTQSAPAQTTPSTAAAFTPDVRPADALADVGAAPREPTMSEAGAPEQSDDLASYFRPGDPEPTGAELIEALHEAGIHTGIGAFTPPGTSPPMAGLAVPDDFELPEGFVRHHQVTDQGEPLEPILMFSPDIETYEAAGNIPIPEDRIVTPEFAPPGMPIREMIPPKP